ncbi:MAG: hypothetical protein DRQ10_04650 [Candidatus Hydrothermota bacterium]|nr:MAG: hypothetical protein DRQ10_04650 [Candidatus Hydrothermae bacterium]
MFFRRTQSVVIVSILLGAAIGTLLGELIRLGLPQGPVRELLTTQVSFGFGAITLNLIVVDVTLGLMVHFNLMSVIFIFLMIFLLKKL